MSGVDNSRGEYSWGAMESTVRSVRLVTFRDLVENKPKRRAVKRKPAKARVKRAR